MATAVKGSGAGGGGTVIGVIVAAAVIFLLVLFLFGEGIYGGATKKLDVAIEVPKVDAAANDSQGHS